MTPPPGSDPRAQQATLAMERNRQQFRAALAPPSAAEADAFPRSATFRWIAAHLSARSLASTAALVRVPFGRLLGKVLFDRSV
jgi:hypothetical protein